MSPRNSMMESERSPGGFYPDPEILPLLPRLSPLEIDMGEGWQAAAAAASAVAEGQQWGMGLPAARGDSSPGGSKEPDLVTLSPARSSLQHGQHQGHLRRQDGGGVGGGDSCGHGSEVSFHHGVRSLVGQISGAESSVGGSTGNGLDKGGRSGGSGGGGGGGVDVGAGAWSDCSAGASAALTYSVVSSAGTSPASFAPARLSSNAAEMAMLRAQQQFHAPGASSTVVVAAAAATATAGNQQETKNKESGRSLRGEPVNNRGGGGGGGGGGSAQTRQNLRMQGQQKHHHHCQLRRYHNHHDQGQQPQQPQQRNHQPQPPQAQNQGPVQIRKLHNTSKAPPRVGLSKASRNVKASMAAGGGGGGGPRRGGDVGINKGRGSRFTHSLNVHECVCSVKHERGEAGPGTARAGGRAAGGRAGGPRGWLQQV